jgi:putative endonuclease
MMKSDPFYIYAIVSSRSRIYVGMSQDIDRRIIEHNTGKVFSTKPYIPWTKFFEEIVGSADQARLLEKYYKSAAGKRKLRGILKTLDSGSLPE